MKPEVVEFLFDYYLQQKQQSTCYDSVDGIFYTRERGFEQTGYDAGEAGFNFEDRYSELQYLHPQASCPHEQYHAPLDNEQRELAVNLGRQIFNMAEEFDIAIAGPRPVSLVDGSSEFRFMKQRILVAPTAEKVTLSVVRSEGNDRVSTLVWRTKNDTAVAGTHYVNSSGNINFGRGETQKVIEIQLLKNHEDHLITFEVQLYSEPVGDGRKISAFVNISDDRRVSEEEQSIMQRIIECQRLTYLEVTTYLSEKVTSNTFKTALLCLSGNGIGHKHELALAFSLANFAVKHSFSRDNAMSVLCNFFQKAPELETIVSDDSESESSDNEDSENEELD